MRSCKYQLYRHRVFFLDPDVLRKFKIVRARRSSGHAMFFDGTIEKSDKYVNFLITVLMVRFLSHY